MLLGMLIKTMHHASNTSFSTIRAFILILVVAVVDDTIPRIQVIKGSLMLSLMMMMVVMMMPKPVLRITLA